ncbi:amino acid ABC transporter ATP-binding protein (plasmid) [Rhodococcus pyridinivorans]|uniref:amino acid ABC transporter ATP-binding protein n=1 Tax=Rhodococcus pyridinivorans TaxID=103816 RepID=UPI0020C660D6|nr:amino acid ABC transporter ATP-binding protein [Rhodococcus pyridinivorans]UTM39683.1 amino acid ABC transporter ATP-binding protein [Rhodococcus pyridinivorans]
MSDVLVKISAVKKSYGGHEVLHGIDLEVKRGEVVCILGPSGSGKSTLLRCVNHLEKIDSGRIEVDGELIGYRRKGKGLQELRDSELVAQRQKIGMVFQRFNLFPHMTALENVTIGPTLVGKRTKAEAKERAVELLRAVGLADRMEHFPGHLSGGQQQRVAIARALANRPELMLFDEPTSALDPELVGEVLEVMRRLADTGMTMMIVTHEMYFAREVADTVVVMEAGSIVEHGPARDVLENPQHPRTMAFLDHVK